MILSLSRHEAQRVLNRCPMSSRQKKERPAPSKSKPAGTPPKKGEKKVDVNELRKQLQQLRAENQSLKSSSRQVTRERVPRSKPPPPPLISPPSPPARGLTIGPLQQHLPGFDPVRAYQGLRAADRFLREIPVVGDAYAAGKDALSTKLTDYISGAMSLGKDSNGTENLATFAKHGAVTTSFMNISQTKAAAHGDFPEGGLRIQGELLNSSDDRILVGTNAFITNGAWGNGGTGAPASAGDLQVVGVSPTGYDSNAKALRTNMFGGSGNTISVIADKHRMFRFRKLGLIWEGESATTTTGSVQFSYDADINSLQSNLTAGATSQAAASTRIATRIPAWTPRRVIWLINDMKTSISDRLHSCTQAGTGIGVATLANADAEMYFQGGIAAIHDIGQGVTPNILARYRWIFVLDLYGLSPTTADSSITFGKIPPTITDPREVLALGRAYEIVAQRRLQEAIDEAKRESDEIMAEMRREFDLLTPAFDDEKFGKLLPVPLSRSSKSDMKYVSVSPPDTPKAPPPVDEVNLTDSGQGAKQLQVLVPALSVADEKKRTQLCSFEQEIAELRRRHGQVVKQQSDRREITSSTSAVYVPRVGELSDDDLEKQRVSLSEELRIARDELREFRRNR